MNSGFDVKKSEIHGMSQRGGSVVSHVRFGAQVFSPIIPEGEADILFGFELLESYRCLPLLKKDGKVVANTLRIAPPGVLIGKQSYPDDLEQKILSLYPDSLLVDGLWLATEAGNPRAANTVLLGALSRFLPVEEDRWIAAIEKMAPKKAVEVNKKAFALGRSL